MLTRSRSERAGPIRLLLWESMRGPRPVVALATIVVLLHGVAPMAIAATVAAIVGGLEQVARGDETISAARSAVVVFAATFVVARTLEPLRSAVAGHLGTLVEVDLRVRVLHAIAMRAGVSHLEDPHYLDRVSVALGINTGRYGPARAVDGLTLVSSRTITAVLGAVVLASYSPIYAVVALLVFAATGGRLRRAYYEVVEADAAHESWRRSSYLRDLVLTPAAGRETHLLGLGRWLTDRYVEHWNRAQSVRWDVAPGTRRTLTISLLLQAGTAVVGFAVLARQAALGELGLGAALLAVQSLRVIVDLTLIREDDRLLAEGAGCVPAILDLEAAADADAAAGDLTPEAPTGDIEFRGVSFAYPQADGPAVTDLNFTIERGKLTALVGDNGAGKSTVVKLLCRFYEPDSGEIVASDMAATDIDADTWRRSIAAVFQDFARYRLSLRDNVEFGTRHRPVDIADLDEVATLAGLDDVLADLPAGWDSILSRQFTGGTELSGGQWQRVALSRALLAKRNDPLVVILDEPTSNVDARFEAEFFDAYADDHASSGGATTLLITHRLSNVRRADKLVVLREGRVVEQGSHDDLIALGGVYADMFEAQAASFR